MAFSDNSIKICCFCGEILKSGKLRPTCRTKEQRKAKIEKQLEIEAERGFKTKRLFMFEREALLNFYQIENNV